MTGPSPRDHGEQDRHDLPKAIAALLEAAPGEAGRLAALVGKAGKSLELRDIEVRLQRLEEQQAKR